MSSLLLTEEVFVADYDNQRLRFRRTSTNVNVLLTQRRHTYTLEIVDAKGDTIWTFPVVEALEDLYQAIIYHQAGIGAFVDRLLGQS